MRSTAARGKAADARQSVAAQGHDQSNAISTGKGRKEDMSGPIWKLEDDGKTVTVTFATQPQIALKLSVADMENMLEKLGAFRAQMQPPREPSYAPGQKCECVPNPAWLTEPDALLGNTLLHLRDPRFGWQHYMIPREEARKLARVLQNQVDSPPPGSAPKKLN
jgi:hypothetical protein